MQALLQLPGQESRWQEEDKCECGKRETSGNLGEERERDFGWEFTWTHDVIWGEESRVQNAMQRPHVMTRLRRLAGMERHTYLSTIDKNGRSDNVDPIAC